MTGQERREKILEVLEKAKEPISGSELAKQMKVSRQVIVQDIALLRAEQKEILATPRGYLLHLYQPQTARRVFMVCHDREGIQEELEIIVDLGGQVIDTIVEHPIYGELTARLMVENRKDVQDFIHQLDQYKTVPLLRLTHGVHFHTVEARDEKTLDLIESQLKQKKYLC
ncbi:MAG: transcription repressor NadR [Epulopiscium sp.]|nr:transcription repressor NadR [Candidatus Epulonipiscium sp.]